MTSTRRTSSSTSTRAETEDRQAVPTRNEVLLVGRVSSAPAARELPSGDHVVVWRVVVDRPAGARGASTRAAAVDALDCVAWTAAVRRTVASWSEGDVVHVEGALRRRFWRSPGGLGSRHEVEVRAARRLRRAG